MLFRPQQHLDGRSENIEALQTVEVRTTLAFSAVAVFQAGTTKPPSAT